MGSSASTRTKLKRIAAARSALSAQQAVEPERVKRYEARMARLSAARKREQTGKRWCIVRTAARSTVALADDLEDDGFDVWTPVEVFERRVGRSRKIVERCKPIMPGFIFASEANAGDLLRLSAAATKRCADFSVFHYRDRVPLIADRELGGLHLREDMAAADRAREFERRAREADRRRRADELSNERQRRAMLRNSAAPIPEGTAVNMPSGAWSGMGGVVVKSDRGITTVDLGGMLQVKIDTFLLTSDILEQTGIAA